MVSFIARIEKLENRKPLVIDNLMISTEYAYILPDIYVFDYKISFPKIYWLGLVIVLASFIIGYLLQPTGFVRVLVNIMAVIGVINIVCIFFWNKVFHFLGLKARLRKAGYKGKIKLLSEEDLIKEFIAWGKAGEDNRTSRSI